MAKKLEKAADKARAAAKAAEKAGDVNKARIMADKVDDLNDAAKKARKIAEEAQKKADDLLAAGKKKKPGNVRLRKLIEKVKKMKVSAAEKVKFLEKGAAKLDDVTFKKHPNGFNTEGIFKGKPIGAGATKGQSPVLVVMKDGRVLTGLDVLHPDGLGYYIIDLSKLK